MAIVICPECKKELSETAESCPNCGYPYREKEKLYNKALLLMESCTTSNAYKGVAEVFKTISSHRDATKYYFKCIECANEVAQQKRLKEERELDFLEKERVRKEEQKQKLILTRKERFLKNMSKIVTLFLCILIVGVTAFMAITLPSHFKYENAIELMDNQRYEEAISKFVALDDYKDASTKIDECYYLEAMQLYSNKKYDEAITVFQKAENHKDAKVKIVECYYLKGKQLYIDGEYGEAAAAFHAAGYYKDAKQLEQKCH